MIHRLRTLSYADIATLSNAAIGFTALTLATTNPALAARLILLAAIGDAIDGILAHTYGSSPIGHSLDALSDTVSFVAAPALLLTTLTTTPYTYPIAAVFLCAGVLRLAFYTAHDTTNDYTTGVPTTLAATIITTIYLTGHSTTTLLIGVTLVLTFAMLAPLTYPDLLIQDALVMGALQALTILYPTRFEAAFPIALLFCALAYLLFAPHAYWHAPQTTHHSGEPR